MVAVGPGKIVNGSAVPVGIKADEKVFYKKYAGTTFSVDGEELLIIPSENILAIIGE